MTNYDIIGQRIESLACNKCRTVMDVSEAEPFSVVQCPGCGAQQTVPKRLGNFILLRFLGKGGMGAVFQGYDPKLGRQVAIKVLGDVLGTASGAMDNFLREARAAAQISSPNVVQIFQVGEENGQPFIVMELISGGQLDTMIEQQPLSELRALEVCKHAAQGLYAAQEIGLFHGDIKPENILFDQHGIAKIADFGLAQYLQRGKQSSPGEIWGTPYYIAPEKARRQQEDYRSDIYSLGATLFHTLTGQPPFEGETAAEVVLARLKEEAPDIREIDPNLHEPTAILVARMLDPDPTMRFPNYTSLLSDLDEVINTVKRKNQEKNRSSGKGKKIFLLIVILAMIGAGMTTFFFRGSPAIFSEEEDLALNGRIARWSNNKYLYDAGPIHTINDSLLTFGKSLPPDHPGKAWITIIQGSVLTMGMHTNDVIELLTPVAQQDIPQQLDGKPNPNLMPQIIARFFLSSNNVLEIESKTWPGWFYDVGDYFSAIRLLSQAEYQTAKKYLQSYSQKTRAEDAPMWPYSFQRIAITLSDNVHKWETRQDLLDRLLARGSQDKVREKLTNYEVNTPPLFLSYITSNRERLGQSTKDETTPVLTNEETEAEKERIRLAEEKSRKEREKRAREKLERKAKERAERHDKEKKEQQQKDLAADRKTLRDGIQDATPAIRSRDFKKAMRDINSALDAQITEEGKQDAQQFESLFKMMQNLERYIIKNMGKVKLTTSLTKKLGGTPKDATDKKIILALTHGETAKPWDKINNATYIKVADQIIAKGRSSSSKKAEYYMALTLFSQLIGAPEAWTSRYQTKATENDPDIAVEVSKLMELASDN